MTLCRACTREIYLSAFQACRPFPARHLRPAGASSSGPRAFATVAPAPPADVRLKAEDFQAQFDGQRLGGHQSHSKAVADPKSLERAVGRQLAHLTRDPFKVAEYVRAALGGGRFDEALLLVRKLSGGLQLPVSWNLMIDHLMREKKLRPAIKLFNEMKKRGQLPNAQTYTSIFNGCAVSHHPEAALAEAVKLYHSMLNNDRLKPNVIHLNAVLKVASRAGDLESLFSLIQTVGDGRTPDSQTYTTVLNALRVKTAPWSRPSQETEAMDEAARADLHNEKVQLSISRAKGVWAEVVDRWRAGQLVLDEDLVCAMGRILLTGGAKANSEVLALVEQTMNMPRLDSKAPAGKEGLALEPTAQQSPSSTSSNAYAKPGKNTVSLVLASLGATRSTSLASRYWDLFVGRYHIEPDYDNWKCLLQTLRIGKASTKASAYLERMPPFLIKPANLQMVMMTCVKDNLNEHAFENAEKVLDVMTRVLKVPDAQTLRLYLQAARGHNGLLRTATAKKGSQRGDAGGKLGKQVVRALERMWEPMSLATHNFSAAGANIKPEDPAYQETRELVAVAARMVAATDAALEDTMLGSDVPLHLRDRRIVLSKYISSFGSLREIREPGLNKRRALGSNELARPVLRSRHARRPAWNGGSG